MPIQPIPGFFEPFSSLSHLLAAGLAPIFGVHLLRTGWGRLHRVTVLTVFVLSAVFLLSMSGVYHLLSPGPARDVLHRLDHAAIFTLIAGSFTAIHGLAFTGLARWGMLALTWAIAVAGIGVKMAYFSEMPDWLGLSLYLGMGWMGLVSGVLLWRRFGFRYIRPLVWGALAYTGGALADFAHAPVLWPGVIGSHEVFHVAVLLGLAAHWFFIDRLARHTDRFGLVIGGRGGRRPMPTSAPSPGCPADRALSSRCRRSAGRG